MDENRRFLDFLLKKCFSCVIVLSHCESDEKTYQETEEMKKKTVSKTRTMVALAMGMTMALTTVGMNFITGEADSNSTVRYKSDYNSLVDVVNAESDLNKQIASEGYTLLKNNDDNLPFGKAVKNISLFGKNSVDPVYSGSGSSGGSAGSTISIEQSLKDAGFNLNPTLLNFYKDTALSGAKRPSMGFSAYNYNSYFPTAETPQNKYTDEVKRSYSKYSDAAVIVLARSGGEGTDLPRTSYVNEEDEGKVPSQANARAYPTFDDLEDPDYKYYGGEGRTSDPHQHYLELDDNERALIEEVTEKFDKVVLILDAVNVMELDKDLIVNNDKIQSIIWTPGAGLNGFEALGKILNGEVNPSAKTSDTFAADFLKDPVNFNFANNNVGYYANGTAGNQYLTETGEVYENNFDDFLGVEEVEYEEGIYVGYKYYETRGYTDGEEWYEEAVNYPFGYGLSYTEFSWEVGDVKLSTSSLTEKTVVSVDVTVTNVGTRKGKDVVELYFSAPYTAGKTEKAHVSLAAFEKTKELRPLESQTVTLEFDAFDMASYDAYDKDGDGHVGYELDAGDYNLYVGKDAHDAWTNGTKLTIKGVAEQNIDKDPVTGADISSKFQECTDEMEGHVLSRNDWEGTWPTTPTYESLQRSDEFLDKFSMPVAEGSTKTNNYIATWYDEANPDYPDENGNPGKAPWYSASTPNFRSDDQAYSEANPAPIQLKDMVGIDLEDEKWDDFVSQLTITQAYGLLKGTQFSFQQELALGIPYAGFSDGTMGITGAWVGTSYSLAGNAMGQYDYKFSFAPETVVACTWNKELASEQGRLIGENGLWAHVSGWFAPGGNIHRSQFGGRNFEYYSEDAMLSAQMISNVVKSATDKGMITFMKHFVLNDEECNRDTDGIATWADEQTMRENYFKVFEWGVKYGGSMGMMTSFNRIGYTWSGASYALLTELVRGEWGFKGVYITDAHSQGQGCMNADQMLRAGNEMSLDAKGGTYAVMNNRPESNTSTQLTALYNAVKRVLYVEANSCVGLAYYMDVIESELTYDETKIATKQITVKPGESVDLSISDGDEGARYTVVVGTMPDGVSLEGDKIVGTVADTASKGTYTVKIAKLAENAADGEGYLNSLRKTGGFIAKIYNCATITINVSEDGVKANGDEIVSVIGFEKIGSIDNVDYYAFIMSDGSEYYFTVENGVQGPQGETGATGPKGDTGATGAQGSQGEAGQDGKDAPVAIAISVALAAVAAVLAAASFVMVIKKKN